MKKLTTIIIFCLFTIISSGQDTDDPVEQLFDAIFKKESAEDVRRIIESGVDVNILDEDNCTPLWGASYIHNIDIIKVLIDLGADINIPDINGNTPLNIACYGDGYSSSDRRFNAVKVLIENKADVNINTEEGSTGLMRAVANGQYRVAELLIENGADITPVSNKGESALSWAKRFNYIDLIELIEKNLQEEVVITKNGNVRKGPSTQYGIVGKVTDGQEFIAINKIDDWYKIELMGETIGWINKIIIKEVINLTDTEPSKPDGFSPISNIMNEFNLVASGTYCLIKNSSTPSTWILELLSNADILEFSSSKSGIGKPSGSKIYFNSEGGHDLFVGSVKDENGNTVSAQGRNLIMFSHENGAEYIRWKDDISGEFGPVHFNHLNKFFGNGTSIRFSSVSWVNFGDKQYRNGGFSITNNSIKFMPGTEVKTETGIFKLNFYKWVRLE